MTLTRQKTDQHPRHYHDHASDNVIPEKTDLCRVGHHRHRGHPGKQPDEGSVTIGPTGPDPTDGEDEDTEERSVKIGSEFVDYLDQRAKPSGLERDPAGKEPSETGDDL